MNTLQLSPIAGSQPAPASSGPSGGEAAAIPPNQTHPGFVGNAAAPDAVSPGTPDATQRAVAAAQVANQKAADAKKAAEAQAAESPAYDLKVGLVNGTFDVYVDLTDATNHHVVARLYGPRGETLAKPEAVPVEKAGAAPADASSAYARGGTTSEATGNVQTVA